MIRARTLTILKLRKLIKKGKRILCFGAGGRFYELFEGYENDSLECYVDYIFDNDKKKWDTKRKVNDIDIPILNPQKLREIYSEKYIIIITINGCEEVLEQIHEIVNKKVVCYKTPVIGTQAIGPIRLYMNLFNLITKIMPLEDTIVFGGWGRSQRENETALRDYLISNGYAEKYKIIWMVDTKNDYRLNNTIGYYEVNRTTCETYHTLKELFNYYRANNVSKYYIFENHKMMKKRRGQKSIYLNHGAPPLKKTKDVIILPENTDLCVCSSPDIKNIVSEQFNININKLLYCGEPRFDHIFLEEKYINEFVDSSKYSKMIMWLPTFRQHNNRLSRIDSKREYRFGIPIIENENDFEIINEKLSKMGICLVIKPHPLQNLSYIKIRKLSHIFLLLQDEMDKKNIGVNCLIKDMDAIITDYSTIAFDYMLKDRPIGYTVDDMEDYTLGFSVNNPLEWMPGPHMSDINGLLEFIENVSKGEDAYKIQRNIIRDKVHRSVEPNNCEKLIKMLGL